MSPLSISSVVQRVSKSLERGVLLAASLWVGVAFLSVLALAWLWAGPDGWPQGTLGPLLLDASLLAVLASGVPVLLTLRRRWLAEPRVARCVEEAAGLRPGTVVGSLELSRAVPPGVSRGLASFGEQILLKELNKSDAHLAAPMRRTVLAWTRGALAGLAVVAPLLVLAAVLAPGRSLSAWSGLSSPVFLLSPPVLPALVVLPGDHEVERGGPVQVTVAAAGRESVTLHWQEAGDVPESRTLSVTAAQPAAFDFASVSVPVRYWAVAPDGAESEVFEITPIDPLFVSDLRVVVEFPAHTGRAPEEHRGDVPALTFPGGTRVRVDGRASRALGSGALELRGGQGGFTLEVGGASFSGVWVPRQSGVYEWRFRDEGGASAELAPQPLDITLLDDAAPLVSFSFPAQDTVMPLTLQQPLVIDVEDDYGVVSVDVVAYRVAAGGERGEPVLQRIEVGGARKAIARPLLDMTSWGLLPGDQVRYLARVTDNSPGAQTTETREWILRMPGAAELRRDAQETLEEATRQVEELARQAERAAEETRNLGRQAAAERTEQQRGRAGGASSQEGAGFQQREDVRQTLEQQQGISAEIDSLKTTLESLSEAMRDAGVADPGLRTDLDELQKLLSEIATPELKQQLEEMSRNLDDMDARQAQEMLSQLSQTQEQIRDMLEESLDRFRRAAVEQDFRATTSEAEELARLEQALAEAMKEPGNGELRSQQQADLEKRAQDVQSNMQTLEARLQQIGEEQAAQGVQQAREQTAEARQAMSDAEQQARAGQQQQAAQQAQRAAASMEQAASDLREARQEMANEQSEALRQALEGAADEALALARRQSQIREEMRGATPEEMAALRGDVGAVLQGVRSMTENVASAMQQSGGGGDQQVTDRAQQAAEALERAIESMNQRSAQSSTPATAAEAAVNALNQLALSALNGARQAEEGGQGGQQQQGDMMQQMEGLAQQQGQINSDAGQLMPMQLGQQAMQNQLQELAQGQQSVAGELGRMANEPGSEQMLGDLKALQEEARQLAERLAGGRLDPETRRRQEQLFHRLLDAGRSLEREDELSEQREARTAGSVEARDVKPLTAEAVGAIRFRLPDAAELQRMGPAERQLVIDYFERLNREAETRPVTSAPASTAPATATPTRPGGPR